ncbi:MAG: hypothetical protein H7647_07225 [Candidatus Heimdallarchaeota archaeon]|nr:hypothetical protein [Candidatus Heimdallarchaeota archaeon]MCK4254219.1 hypothetical protein [Candidatus Heimdallarchaeota archaeon]
MRKGLFVNLGVLLLVTSLVFVTPTKAATNWGVETDVINKYELITLKLGGLNYADYLAENLTMRVVFDSFTDTGYTYTTYNSTGGTSVNETIFVEMPVGEENVTLPVGLPIALPLSIGTIPDYLLYFGQFINTSNSFYLLEELLLNITEYANVTYTAAHSLLDETYLRLYFDLFAPEVNSSILSELMDDGDAGLPISLPVNITDFKLNTTIKFNSTSGLFYDLDMKIRSKSHIDEYTEAFDIDIKYALYVPPPPPEPEPEPEPTESPYPWFIPSIAAFAVISILIVRRRK